ncbi:MAG: HEPN domain-containing protein [Desulfobacteraceae bacterium]|nr:MAG: HEPN domain-containing protein [Desulfobacteraceae bacterium]
MTRANETLEDARVLAAAGRWNACVNRLYYSCFYAVSALLVRHGLSSTKHTGVRSLFNKQYVKTDKIPKDLARIYNDLFERRQEGDYIDFVNFQEAQVTPWISKAEQLIQYVATLVEKETA